jgi:catalase
MALEFELPQKQVQHFTMLNVPVFGAATPNSFYDGVVANTPDPTTGKPDPEKQAAFKVSHPDAQALAEYLAKNNPVASYANSDFYSVHTFKFINKKNQATLVKWRFVPQDGIKRLSDEELKTAPARFLDDDIMAKTKSGPVRWDMVLIIGDPSDEQTNPTVYWPAERKQIKAGVLTLTSASAQLGGACEKINFDPLVMAQGIAPTNDPVLLFRSPAYADSYAKRLTGK